MPIANAVLTANPMYMYDPDKISTSISLTGYPRSLVPLTVSVEFVLTNLGLTV